MKNEEDLDAGERDELETIRNDYFELGSASVLKEKLRSIYHLARDFIEAEWLLADWCAEAEATGVSELKTMAKTIQRHIGGILAYWTTGGVTSSAMEGFNNKIRWLIKQAYGYHDQKYFKLKIFDLPNIKITKNL